MATTTRPRHHGRRATRWATNQWRRPSSEHRAEVDGNGQCVAADAGGLVAGAAEGAAQVAAEQAERRDRAGRPGGRSSTTARASASVARPTTPSGRQTAQASPHVLGPCRIVIGASQPVVDDCDDGGHDAAEQARRRRRPRPSRWRARGRRRAIWRSRSMSCFTLRTKSPPDISSSASTLAEVVAGGPGVGQREEAGVGRPGERQAGLVLVGVELARPAARGRPSGARTPRDGNHGAGRPVRAPGLVGEAATPAPATAAGSRSSNSPAPSASATSRSHSW